MELINVPHAELLLDNNFLGQEEALSLYEVLSSEIIWRQDEIKIFGKTYLQPRKTAIYGDKGISYTYSGITMPVNPWTPDLIELKKKVEEKSESKFNFVLLNWYRNGQDSMGWHSDDEKELGPNPIIASLSLGVSRDFKFRPRKNCQGDSFKVQLSNGSLLIMKGETQHFWQHAIDKSKKIDSGRINLTFRNYVEV